MIFNPSEIILPAFDPSSEEFKKWAVIACDQYTSSKEYWENAFSSRKGFNTALNYFLPEYYIGSKIEKEYKNKIRKNHAEFEKTVDYNVINGYIYIERTLPDGKIREGILGKIDLEYYDYKDFEHLKVKPSEETVVERLPARVEIRKDAFYELPHILIFTEDRKSMFESAKELSQTKDIIYDFDLSENGGHITGYSLTDEKALKLSSVIAENESEFSCPYIVGDGNHSLAAAKMHYENLKKTGNADNNHPSRYALCEIINFESDSLVIEPIYRLLYNVNPEDLKSYIETNFEIMQSDEDFNLILKSNNYEIKYKLNIPDNSNIVGEVQKIADSYINLNKKTKCDYIHNMEEIIKLSGNDDSVGFIFDSLAKSAIFDAVSKGSPLPRKSFSIGEADSKRFYIEMRKIK